jgi:hypothetical protein
MSYSDGEVLILGLLRNMAQFDTRNSGRARWGMLNSGAAAQYAILRAGPFENDYQGLGREQVRTSWRTIIELWQRYKDDGTSATDLQELMAAVIEYVEQYPDLGDAAIYAEPRTCGDMQEVWRTGGDGPSWLKWEVNIDWQEERDIA